jgi:hypothetical protein
MVRLLHPFFAFSPSSLTPHLLMSLFRPAGEDSVLQKALDTCGAETGGVVEGEPNLLLDDFGIPGANIFRLSLPSLPAFPRSG